MKKIPVILCLMIVHFYGYSQTIDIKLDTTQHLIADYIHLVVKVEQPKGIKMHAPSYNLSNTAFDTILIEKADTIIQPNGLTFKQKLTITCYDTGWVVLPIFPCALEKNGIVDTLYSPPLKLYVASVPIDTTRGLKNIKNPLPVSQPWIKWWMLVGVLVLVGLLYYFFKYLKKIGSSATQEKKSIATAPLEEALLFLEKLEKEKAWENTDLKTYYTKISLSIRAYLMKTLDKKAMEMTSTELLQVFEKDFSHPSSAEKLHHLLHLSDMVKFAKATPDDSAHIDTLRDAKEWLKQTDHLFKTKMG